MKNKFLFFLLLCTIVLYSQENPYDLPRLVPPSPTVANLMLFEEVPVNNYTGQPDIRIPLFSKSIHQGLGLNVALSYNTQGIKIDNRSGWNGTGWSLFAGGSVSRTVRGLPDEINDPKRTGIYHNNDFWNYENLSSDQKAEFTWNAVGTPYDHYDVEFDLYQFSLLGISGRFIVTKDGPQLLSNEANVKITLNQDTTSGIINNFIITDTNGYRYHFDVTEESVAKPFSGSIPQGGQGSITPTSNDDVYAVRSAWHLSKITTSNFQVLASFQYQDSHEEYVTSYSEIYNKVLSKDLRVLTSISYNTSIMRPEYSFTSTTMSTTTKKLSKINFLDGITIDFLLGGKHPETNGAILQDIVINNADSSEHKRYRFIYEQTDRLWLTKVIETPITGLPKTHILNYFNKEKLASFNSDSDPWGYNYTPIVNANYDPTVIQAGLLTGITTPTGGVKEFVWEENTYSYKGDYKLQEVDYIKNPNNTDTQFYTSNFTALSPFVSANPVALTTFVSDHAQRLRIRIQGVSGFQHENDRVKVILSPTASPEDGIYVSLKNEVDYLDIEKGTYNVFVQYLGHNIDPNITEVDGTVQITYQSKIDGPLSEFMLGGGVRIKEVLFKDTMETSIPSKRILYGYNTPGTSIVSSGAVDIYENGSLEDEYNIDVAHTLFIQGIQFSNTFKSITLPYHVKSKGTRSELTKGGYIGYKYVTVSEQDKGYTHYTYTSTQDYPSADAVFSFPFYPTTNLDYKRGLLLTQEIFDKDNRKLQEVENTNYAYINSKITNLYKAADLLQCDERQFYNTYRASINGTPERDIPVCKSTPCKQVFNGCIDPDFQPNIMMRVDMDFTWAQLKERVTKDYFYDASGTASIVETKTNYDYNNENYQASKVTKTISEAGVTDTYVEELFYPVGGYPIENFTATQQAAITKMITLNKVNAPIYTQTNKNDTLISTIQNSYHEFVPNIIAPQYISSSKGIATQDNRLTYHQYDDYGNPLEVSQAGGAHIIYIWGYHHTKPIAKITNASYIGMPQEVTTLINDVIALSNIQNTEVQAQSMRDHFARLRAHTYFKDAQIICFTYDPLKGVTSQSDPRGYTIHYTYDSFNRLEYVKDAQGNLISENKYHYKNQQ